MKTDHEPQIVYVKTSNTTAGVGDLPCERLWESEPDDSGEFVHLSEADDGTLYLSGTDMENHHGSYYSVPVTGKDLVGLADLLIRFWCEDEPECEADDPSGDDPEG